MENYEYRLLSPGEELREDDIAIPDNGVPYQPTPGDIIGKFWVHKFYRRVNLQVEALQNEVNATLESYKQRCAEFEQAEINKCAALKVLRAAQKALAEAQGEQQ